MSVTYFRNFKTHAHSYGSKLRRHMMGQHKTVLMDLPSADTQIELNRDEESKMNNQRAFGYVYYAGPQKLSVSVPGDVTPVRFDSHTVLQGLSHDDNSPEILAGQSGIYEISYTVSAQSDNSAYAAFAVQIDGQTVDGSMTAKLINAQGCVYNAAVITEIKQGTLIRLVMTSGTTISVETTGNGVSASMMIKMLA